MARILIGEDEALTALDLEEILREAGHEIVAVIARVADGFAHIEGTDIAVLDVELADGSSIDLARALAQAGAKVLFVTGNRDEDLPDNLPGPSHEKPFMPSALIAAIAKLADERDANGPVVPA